MERELGVAALGGRRDQGEGELDERPGSRAWLGKLHGDHGTGARLGDKALSAGETEAEQGKLRAA
jgi:hypothetical protein